jgi:hypothetical protein
LLSVQSSDHFGASTVSEESAWVAFTVHRPAGGPELSVVVPTFNEPDDIELLLARLEAALCGIE